MSEAFTPGRKIKFAEELNTEFPYIYFPLFFIGMTKRRVRTKKKWRNCQSITI